MTTDPRVALVTGASQGIGRVIATHFTEALAAEARPAGVGVFVISPGMVKTDMTAGPFADDWDDPDV